MSATAKDPFRTRDHVGDFDEIVAEIVRRSADARANIPMIGDLAYGPDAAETLDLFFPAGKRSGLPVHLFIHGGYWRMFSRRDYSCVAETVTRAGAIAVIVDFAVMPAVRMATIVDQVRRARRWVKENIGAYGGNPYALSVSGHSAGAHLATMLFDDDEGPSGIDAALLLSGLYDLKPLQTSFLAAEIAITDEEASRLSPLTHRFNKTVSVTVAVGADETPPFHNQADAFVRHLRAQRLSVTQTTIAGANHMSSVRDLALPGAAAATLLADVIRA